MRMDLVIRLGSDLSRQSRRFCWAPIGHSRDSKAGRALVHLKGSQLQLSYVAQRGGNLVETENAYSLRGAQGRGT